MYMSDPEYPPLFRTIHPPRINGYGGILGGSTSWGFYHPVVVFCRPQRKGRHCGTGRVVRFGKTFRFVFRTTGGETVMEPVFEDAWDFKNGYARVKKDGKWGFVAESGKVVVEPKYDYVWDFDGGRAKVRLDDGTVAFIDPAGKRLEER